mmetsp:Transcript_11589/g.32089  ORF Transcript_11589/g.32089 Transcript_11589/m.32089 type:complete len:226 (-) Transcript_11589:961-1638(-)
MTSNQHGHQIVTQNHGRQIFASHVHQESKQRWIFGVVTLFQFFNAGFPSCRDGLIDEVSQNIVKHCHVFAELHLASHPLVGVWQVPVRNEGRRTVFRLAQNTIHCLHHRRFLGNGPKVVIEDRFANNVQGHTAKSFFHVHHFAILHSQIIGQDFSSIRKQVDHSIQPPLVKAWHNGTASHLPSRWICRDETFSHDGFQNLGQHALAVLRRLCREHLTGHGWVGEN